ncbi:MAG: carboxypeptidase regulatory-like domain-containing protein [Bryobacteraceae bacterium]|nr:carboxypeptidase regulatory-like domain-containing protein [Bryobacteraceae bacterium]
MQTRCIQVFAAALIAAALWSGTQARAQVLYGTVVGVATDSSGSQVPRAAVKLTAADTGQIREALTDEQGRFNLANVLPGAYTVSINAAGFKPVNRTGVPVTISSVTRVDFALEVGSISDSVTVSGDAAVLQTEKSDVRTEIGSKAIVNLPISNYRNYQSLINLTPGSTPAALQNAVMDTPQRSLTTNVNGTNRNFNTTRVDGTANIFVSLPHHVAYVPPVETIEAVNVTTSSFDAEVGMAGGAAVTVTTKSGTNDLHGVAFWYHDNQKLRARNYFLRTPSKPRATTNIMGGTLGGPVIRNKLFFFGGFEGLRERSGRSVLLSVPTAQQRTGDFSGLPVTLYDPATGNLETGTGRTPFPDNRIPAARFSGPAVRLLRDVPLPNLQGLLSNYAGAGTQVLDRDNYDGKINWNRTATHSVWAKYSRMNALVDCGYALGEAGGPGLCSLGVGTADTKVHVGSIGHTWALTPTLLLDGNFGVSYLDTTGTSPDFGKNYGTEIWGIPGTNVGDERYSGMPWITTGFGDWGNPYNWMPLFRADRSWTYTANVSKVAGAHELRFGFDAINMHLNTWQPNIGGGPRGQITFAGGVTALNGGAVPTYLNSSAAFLLGLPSAMSRSLQTELQTGREWQFGAYVRDRWQVNRNLTLNIGVRWEYYPLITRAERGIERWDPFTNLVYLGGVGNNPQNAGIEVSKGMFAPRVGIAYRLGSNTVIRSGYGMNIDPVSLARPLRALYPSVIEATFQPNNTFAPFRTLSEGIPAIPVPNVSSGVIALPSTVSMGPRSLWGGKFHRGYIQSWNLTAERRLPFDLVSSVAYVGTQSTRMTGDLDINAAAPGGGQLGRPLNATIGRRVDSLMMDGWLSSNYHSLQASLNRQFSNGLMLKTAYTYSKAINMTDDAGWAGLSWNYAPVIGRNRARAGYDRTHMFVGGAVYELPFGPGKALLSSCWASQLARGWQTNTMVSMYTGSPFTVVAAATSLNAPGNIQTADQVNPVVNKLGRIGPGEAFYDPLAFRAVTDVRFGSTGRNILDGPGLVNMDLSIFRTFRLAEKVRLEFKAEAFNFTNTPQFLNPGANASNMTLNSDGTLRTLGNFMSVTSARETERQFRFGLRLSF